MGAGLGAGATLSVHKPAGALQYRKASSVSRLPDNGSEQLEPLSACTACAAGAQHGAVLPRLWARGTPSQRLVAHTLRQLCHTGGAPCCAPLYALRAMHCTRPSCGRLGWPRQGKLTCYKGPATFNSEWPWQTHQRVFQASPQAASKVRQLVLRGAGAPDCQGERAHSRLSQKQGDITEHRWQSCKQHLVLGNPVT